MRAARILNCTGQVQDTIMNHNIRRSICAPDQQFSFHLLIDQKYIDGRTSSPAGTNKMNDFSRHYARHHAYYTLRFLLMFIFVIKDLPDLSGSLAPHHITDHWLELTSWRMHTIILKPVSRTGCLPYAKRIIGAGVCHWSRSCHMALCYAG